ncbi:DUF2019 domain-containing protein [uncultured Desulfobacter sp.]|uniref:DUF2019 domain-containing protein n=1 Tax=uncultured Desulfobacter sp. TaxID=240139 RepID=UPI0029F53FA3|nr:DUF2019 domain-containing protein [uncultured Desulfobacter sp.]
MHNNIHNYIREYIEAAIEYGEGIQNGDTKRSDKYFDKIEKLYNKLRMLGDSGLDELSVLLNHEKESVKLWASAHLLNYSKYESYKVLEDIKDSGSILGLTAEITLDQWKHGNIKY